jgi:hypothetical protein
MVTNHACRKFARKPERSSWLKANAKRTPTNTTLGIFAHIKLNTCNPSPPPRRTTEEVAGKPSSPEPTDYHRHVRDLRIEEEARLNIRFISPVARWPEWQPRSATIVDQQQIHHTIGIVENVVQRSLNVDTTHAIEKEQGFVESLFSTPSRSLTLATWLR